MKILMAGQRRSFCLHVPLTILCNRVGAALLAGSVRRTERLTDGSVETSQTAVITRDQAYAMLKALSQSKRTLKASGLPLVDMERSDGKRLVITL